MTDRLYEIMYDLEEIIRLIEDMKCSLNIQYTGVNEKEDNQIKGIINVQLQLLRNLEADSRIVHEKLDDTILDLIHKRL